MKYFDSTFIFLIILYSCQDSNCISNSAFEEKFEKSIEVVLSSENGKDMYIDEKLDAIYFLESVSGYKSQINDPHIVLYKDKQKLKVDLQKWQNWYSNNKCSMTKVKVDSLFQKYHNYKW